MTRDNPVPTGLAPKYKIERRGYDAEGNVTSFTDEGDEQVATDDVVYTMQYSNEANTHITRAFSITAAQASNSTVLRKRTATFDAGKGTMSSLTNIVSGGKLPGSGTPGTVYNQASATYTFTYDAFGNLCDLDGSDGLPAQVHLRHDGADLPDARRRSLVRLLLDREPTTCGSAPSRRRATSTGSLRATATMPSGGSAPCAAPTISRGQRRRRSR